MQDALSRRGLHFVPSGGGLSLVDGSAGRVLAKSSQVGPAYLDLVRHFGAGFPGHPTPWFGCPGAFARLIPCDAPRSGLLGRGFLPCPEDRPGPTVRAISNRKAPPMRALLSLLLATTALPTLADTIPATSVITAVTVYPDGAKLTREVTFTAPIAGTHELLVTDMPATTEPGLIRLAPSEGLRLGAFNLRADRLPPREDPLTPEQEAAKVKVEELEAAEQAASLALDAVNAKVEAAEAQVRFLSSFTGALPDQATPDTIKSMAVMIGAETLAARQAALAAQAELFPARKALVDTQEALEKARAAYDALPSADMDYTALSVAVTAAAAGEQTVTVTQYVGGASWRPVYDLNLSRKDGDALTLDRSVLVTQYTGEDWAGVALTLSSSRPSEQAAPSPLWPELRSIGPEVDEQGSRPESHRRRRVDVRRRTLPSLPPPPSPLAWPSKVTRWSTITRNL